MKINNKIRIESALVLLVLLIFIVPYVFASGVSAPYWNGKDVNDTNIKPLIMNSGDTKDFSFVLSNTDSNQNDTFKVKIVNGSEVLSIIDAQSTYFVPVGATNVPVNFRASIPADAPPGMIYNVILEFSSAPDAHSGQFQFGSSFVQKFRIVVAEKQNPPVQTPVPVINNQNTGSTYIIIIILLLAIIVVLLLIIMFRRKANVSTRSRR